MDDCYQHSVFREFFFLIQNYYFDFYFSKLFFQFIAGIGIALGGGCFYFAEDVLKIGKYSPNLGLKSLG